MSNRTVTAVPGVTAGHWTHPSGTTGVTALLFDRARGGVWVPGSATGTREMGVLSPTHLASHLHGLCLSGGSAFGLGAADGVMQVLEGRGVGFETPFGRVPIVPAAILFDLHTARARPDKQGGAAAAEVASADPLPEGRVGAGAGARVGGASGAPVPGGVGGWSEFLAPWTVGVVAVVNAVGSVKDPDTGRWIAGGEPMQGGPPVGEELRGNTTLVAVVTDAPLYQGQLEVLAKMAAAGLARTLYPAFTPFDGDVVFSVSTSDGSAVEPRVLAALGDLAATAAATAIVRAVSAEG